MKQALKDSLLSFYQDVALNQWRGREREAVSHFVTGHLSQQVGSCAEFNHLSQAVIEGALAQWPDSDKKHVNKDLLLWSKPGMTTWNREWVAQHTPVAVLEWKVHRPKSPFRYYHPHDVEWLQWFTRENPESFGLLVALDIASQKPELNVGLVEFGRLVDSGWINTRIVGSGHCKAAGF